MYPIAVERGWMTRADALARSLAALRFFAASEQGGEPDATGYNGFYYHFLDRATGRRVWRSELSMVDTALLIAGALVAQRYFGSADADETALRALVDGLYGRVDWRWAQNGGATIMQGWKPECGFLHYGWEGYNEAIVLYVLALGSPSHPLDESGYLGWTVTYQWENIYGHEFLYGGPLFMHQFSHAWIDFRGIRDEFMREKRCDYFENSRRATLVQREYARRNPHEFDGYDERTLGPHRLRRPGALAAALRGDRRQFSRLCGARRAVRSRRRHARRVGRRGVAAVRTRNCAGRCARHARPLSGDARRRVLCEQLQSDTRARRRRLGFGGIVRPRPGHRCR